MHFWVSVLWYLNLQVCTWNTICVIGSILWSYTYFKNKSCFAICDFNWDYFGKFYVYECIRFSIIQLSAIILKIAKTNLIKFVSSPLIIVYAIFYNQQNFILSSLDPRWGQFFFFYRPVFIRNIDPCVRPSLILLLSVKK